MATLTAVLARYRYRIEPTESQRAMFTRTFGCVRVVFNDAVRCRERAWRSGEKVTPTEDQRRVIREAKTRKERSWLSEMAPVALVQSVRDAHRTVLAAGRAERQNACGAGVSPSCGEATGEAGSTPHAV